MSETKVKSYRFGDYSLEIENYRLLKDGDPVSLTHKSFEVLQFLIENRGRILKKEELLDSLWEGNYVEEANSTQHIYMLRKALKQDDSKDIYIETIPKNGYRFIAEVEESFSDGNGIHITNRESLHDTFDNEKSPEQSNHYKTVQSGEFKQYSGKKNKIPQKIAGFSINKFLYAGISLLGLFLIGFIFYLSYFNILSDNQTVSLNSRTIAVLPFEQIEKEKDEKLGIGIADVLIARLANIESLTVRPTTSIIRFAKTENTDLSRIGNELDADFIISGTVQREGNQVRVTTQFYSVKNKHQLWTIKFDEPYTDIFTLQDKISEKIAGKLLANSETN